MAGLTRKSVCCNPYIGSRLLALPGRVTEAHGTKRSFFTSCFVVNSTTQQLLLAAKRRVHKWLPLVRGGPCWLAGRSATLRTC